MIRLELMEKIEAFEGMNDDQLNVLHQYCEEVEYQRGDKLFTEGDKAKHLWFVVEGMVDLRFEMPDGRSTSDEQTVSTVEVRNRSSVAKTLGWSCWVPPFKMRLSAYCITRTCKIVRLKKEELNRLFEKDSKMGYVFMSHIVRVVGFRFQQFQDEVAKNMGESLMSGW